MRRYTIKELQELTDREFLNLVVLDRRSNLTNQYTPLYMRLTQLSGRLEDESLEGKVLRTVLGVIANVIELLEAEANDGFYNPKAGLDKLNELVVYIAGQLNPRKET